MPREATLSRGPAHQPRLNRAINACMYALCALCALLLVSVLALVLGYLVSIGAGSLSVAFFTQLPTGDLANPGGMRHAIEGTLMLIGAASLLGIPIGLATGVYLSEYAAGLGGGRGGTGGGGTGGGLNARLGKLVRFTADVLAGVPSIVVGVLGYELLVVPAGHYSGFAGAIVLAFIMVPIVARTTEEMLRLVPRSYREGSLALGAGTSQTILRVVLPASAGSLVTGVMLAVARVAGETAPLLFTALGSRLLTRNLSEPFPSLTLQIYSYATGPYPEQKRLAWAGILVLVLLLLALNLLVRVVVARTARPIRTS